MEFYKFRSLEFWKSQEILFFLILWSPCNSILFEVSLTGTEWSSWFGGYLTWKVSHGPKNSRDERVEMRLLFVGSNPKRGILKRVFQENKARYIFQKNEHFLPPWCAHVRKCSFAYPLIRKCSFFGKFDVLCFLEASALWLALLPNYRRIIS